MQTIHIHNIRTPLGDMTAGVSASGVHLLEFLNPDRIEKQRQVILQKSQIQFSDEPHRIHEQLRAELEEYFSGKRSEFSVKAIPTGTEFQMRVWSKLQEIPYGRTWSYLELADSLGDPKAVRAVAKANGENPIAILIPCHRVIGKDGNLTGYAGGLDRKRKLLSLERQSAGSSVYIQGDQLNLF